MDRDGLLVETPGPARRRGQAECELMTRSAIRPPAGLLTTAVSRFGAGLHRVSISGSNDA